MKDARAILTNLFIDVVLGAAAALVLFGLMALAAVLS